MRVSQHILIELPLSFSLRVRVPYRTIPKRTQINELHKTHTILWCFCPRRGPTSNLLCRRLFDFVPTKASDSQELHTAFPDVQCPVSRVPYAQYPSVKCWCSSCPTLFALFMKPEKLCLSSKLMRSPIKRPTMLCKTLCEDSRAPSWIDFCA